MWKKGNFKVGIYKVSGMLLLVVFLVMGMPMQVIADFGDYNDYDYGGGYDYDFGGGYDYDYDYGGNYDWDIDYDTGYGYNSTSSGGGNTGLTVIFIIVYIAIIIVSKSAKAQRRSESGPQSYDNSQIYTRPEKTTKILPNRTDEINRLLTQRDAFFSAPDFISFAKRVYMDIQAAWEKRDLGPVRGVLHQNLYQQTLKQVEKKIEDGIVNHLEMISISTCYLTSYKRDVQYEYLGVYLAASMIDYQVQEATGEVIHGDKETRWPMYYRMIFMRSSQAKTKEAGRMEEDFMCPNCGAPLKGTSYGVCEYCGSSVTVGEFGWVLCDYGAVTGYVMDEGIDIDYLA